MPVDPLGGVDSELRPQSFRLPQKEKKTLGAEWVGRSVPGPSNRTVWPVWPSNMFTRSLSAFRKKKERKEKEAADLEPFGFTF